MINPFHYGEVVTGDNFTDREEELKTLISDLTGSSRIFLVSPRRYGKTSLIMKTLEEAKKKDCLTVYVDLFRASSLEELAALYAKSLFSAVEGSIEKVIRFIKEVIPSLNPEITLNEEGKPTFSMGRRPAGSQKWDDVFNLPEKIAKKRGVRMIVALDEFQEITNLGGIKLEKTLRSYIQNQTSVSYLFAGSKRHVLTEMVTNRARAFYNMGKLMTLEKIPKDLFTHYILERFHQTKYKIDIRSVTTILEETDNVPNNVQMLCHELWELCRDKKIIEKEDIKKSIETLVKTRSVLYSATWDSLSLHQRRFLKAVAIDGRVPSPTASDFLHRHNLGASTSVQRSIQRLIKRDILDKQEEGILFTDTLMKEWIRLRMI